MNFSELMRSGDFIMLDLFGDLKEVQGKEISCVWDEDLYEERKGRKNSSEYAEGVYTSGAILMCKQEDLGFRPEFGDLLTVEGKEWTVGDVKLSAGLLEITLESNDS